MQNMQQNRNNICLLPQWFVKNELPRNMLKYVKILKHKKRPQPPNDASYVKVRIKKTAPFTLILEN